MRNIIKKLQSSISKNDSKLFSAGLMPETPLFVIGDIHGRADLLSSLLKKIPNNAKLVFVGDLIDRGHASADVLSTVKDLCDANAVCLLGNHESMMLAFLEHPTKYAQDWFRYGGIQTLESFNIDLVEQEFNPQYIEEIRVQLLKALPNGMCNWLQNLPLQWSSGNIHIVHAAADPNLKMDQQKDHVLSWGCSSFFQKPRKDGQWVVHGHTIFDVGNVQDGRIAVDTGAYLTEQLTGAYITTNNVEFITT